MRAVRCAVNFNEILQKVVGLEEMYAESTDTVTEKCVFASQKLPSMWLNGDGTDLQTLDISPTNISSTTTAPVTPRGFSFLPREPPNQTVWVTAGLLVLAM